MSNRSASVVDWSSVTYKMYNSTEIEQACATVSSIVKPIRRGGRRNDEVYNDVIIGADTETSKTKEAQYDKAGNYVPNENIVVAWTISVRVPLHNICTIYGAKPSDFVKCLGMLHTAMGNGRTCVYFHFLSYDYTFLRQFLYAEFGKPVKQLNTKPHYPILIEFENGILLKDSLIISQTNLEKWANDLDVEHKKAVGMWDYDTFRTQTGVFTAEELEYIEHDTLALVECLDKIRENLHKHTYNIPVTCTAIIREALRIEGRKNRAHNRFLRIAPNYDLYRKLEQMYHGGFTHCNRHTAGWIWDNVIGWDIASSYPTRILVDKMPMERFRKLEEPITAQTILAQSENTAFCFSFIATDIKLRNDDEPMPVLQLSKCRKTINALTDNGRILEADMVCIDLNEIDLELIMRQFTCKKAICFDVYCARKDFLPRWFRNFVYQCFVDKCHKKGGDPVDYALAKARLNSLYGCIVQKPIKPDIVEDYSTGEYKEVVFSENPIENAKMKLEHDKSEFDKYMDSFNSILPYYWGCWVTSCAMKSLHLLGACVDYAGGGEWLYCDTDSVYATKWDADKLNEYNASMRTRMLAQGFDAVRIGEKEYWCGVAEYDSCYKQFIALHSKCYAGIGEDDEIHITVAGVPKKGGAKCLKSLDEFKYGFVFEGKRTGKLTHYYVYRNGIEVKNGIEYGDSIDLSPCDYMIKPLYNKRITLGDLEEIVGKDDVEMQVYGDDGILL